MKSIGIVTYHSAYNFGSVLQAFATQEILTTFGNSVDIINYRMLEQKKFYQLLYRSSYGFKTWVKDMLQLPCQAKRLQRFERFELFFTEHFSLTPEVCEPEEVAVQWQKYDLLVSGSDQIWNKHSYELEHNDWKYMEPYLLKGYCGRKISYASSVCNMTNDELLDILPELREFDALSFRESISAKKISELLGRPVESVLDPTFLLTKDEWIAHLSLKEQKNDRFILAYFLIGPKELAQLLPVLVNIAKKQKCKIKMVTPFAWLPYLDNRIEYNPDYGPVEFLNALYNAEAVITNSYHGTVLSVNFEKNFYSICKSGGSEFRKTDILERLGLLDRVVNDESRIPELPFSVIDYSIVCARLNILRQQSLNYLRNALGE